MTSQPIAEFDIDPAPDAGDREAFRIHDDAAATWAMRKLRAIRAKQAEAEAIAQRERARIDAWLGDALHATEADERYFSGLLIDYARRQRDDEGRKTITLPYGTVKSRAAAPKVTVDNTDAFITWANHNAPDMVRVKVEPDMPGIKAGADLSGSYAVNTSTGEVIPGLTVEHRDATFTVEVEL